MKVIFVISSASGGTEEYERYWQNCLENGNRSQIQNEADNKIEINTDSGVELHIFSGLFYFDKYQQEDVKYLAKGIMSVVEGYNNLDSPIFVLFHGPVDKMESLKKKLSENAEIVFKYKDYHSDDPLYDNYIKPFGTCDKNVSNLAEKLLKEVEGKSRATEALTLRYEILSPLVALDLLTQAGKDAGIKDKIVEALNTIVKEDTEEGDKDQIDKLCELLECNDSENQGDFKAGSLGTRLKKLISKSKESMSIDHNELKTIAGELETKIAEIPYQ